MRHLWILFSLLMFVSACSSVPAESPTREQAATTEPAASAQPDPVEPEAAEATEVVEQEATEAVEPEAAEAVEPEAAEAVEPEATEAAEAAEPPIPDPTARVEPTATAVPANAPATYFTTLPPRATLPTDQACADAVRTTPLPETHQENSAANETAGGPTVRIDGADEEYNAVLAPRITGNFTGTTEELIRWVACKWGFDEDLTRARAWTESSWDVGTKGDQTDYAPGCDYLGLSTPCFQSYGLLQVKGTVHEGTYPFAHTSTAWGLDYAMAWQRACFEGGFSWLVDQGYGPGDVNGCVGAWYSGEWFDDLAVTYLADVGFNLANRPWE